MAGRDSGRAGPAPSEAWTPASLTPQLLPGPLLLCLRLDLEIPGGALVGNLTWASLVSEQNRTIFQVPKKISGRHVRHRPPAFL